MGSCERPTGELRLVLRDAGLRFDEFLPLDAVHSHRIAAPWLVHGFRAGGSLVFARRST
jgi:hypothetical protein